jgi:L-lactate dehydrogenase
MRGIGSEIVLVDIDAERAQAEADDILHAVPFAHPIEVNAGDYRDLAGSKVVVITAGAGQKPGETRLELLGRNARVIEQIVPDILRYAADAILLVATNPVDALTHIVARRAAEQGVPANKVFGSGTTLDTARFRALLGRYIGVDARHIHGYVVGEHGDSEVLTWSLVAIGGIPFSEYCRMYNFDLCREVVDDIDQQVRRAAYRIIEGKGMTNFGIGSALARIIEAILNDQRAILTVCTPVKALLGVSDVTVALPNLVGGSGIISTLPLPLDEEENRSLANSARVIRTALDELGA